MPAPALKRIRPKELTETLLNPHKGCATFNRFNGDAMRGGRDWPHSTEFPPREFEGVAPGYLPCTVAYCRWFWMLFEPEEGRYDWSVIDKALEVAEERRQTLQVRLMPHGSAGQAEVPQWYRDRCETVMKVTHGGKKPCNVPIYDSPEYIDKWGAVIAEFGRRYDGHPWLESVDISFIGPWGEGAGQCSDEAIDTVTQIYVGAHPKTPLMTMISGHKMAAGVQRGTGWRLDCFGDVGIFDNPNLPPAQWWMHHYDSYPKEVCLNNAQHAWKNGPITLETCGVPARWHEKGFDLPWILRQGYKFHGSILMPKSMPIPADYLEPLGEFCDRLGYKFVLRQARVAARAKPGKKLPCSVWIENVGVAPIYHRYDFVIRLTQDGRTHEHRSAADVKTWLPGDAWLEEKIAVPDDFRPGAAMLHAGLRRPDDPTRMVTFANEGTDPDGWLPLDTIEIV